MCAGASFWTQLKKIVYGASDSKRGFSNYNEIIHPKTEVVKRVLEKDCSKILTDFFKTKRY